MAFNGLHGDLVQSDGIHSPFTWIVADAAALAALNITVDDVNKIAWQQDTNELYALEDTTPTWQLVGGAGAVALDDLSDVTITAPTDGDLLHYDYGTGYWVNIPASTLSSHAVSDAVTNALSPAVTLQHNTSGTAAAGFGTSIEFQADDDTNPDQKIGEIGWYWTDPTDTSEVSGLQLIGLNSGSEREIGVINSPVSASTVGNTRGNGAVDLQTYRTAATYIALGNYSALLGGKNNLAYSAYCAVVGGYNSYVGGLASAILGGFNNYSYAYAGAVLGGKDHTLTGDYSGILGGVYNQTQQPYTAVIGGHGGKANHYGQIVTGSYRSARGDQQTTIAISAKRSVTHSDANWYPLFTDGSAARLGIASNSVWTYDILVQGVISGGLSKTFSFSAIGCIKNSAGTTSMLASSVTTIYNADDTNFGCRITANDTQDSLDIEVSDSGASGDTVLWYATVRMVEQSV